MSSKRRVCSRYRDCDIHVNIYNALFNYYREVDSFNPVNDKFYLSCTLETRKYLEQNSTQLDVSEREMLYLIDKMSNDSYIKLKNNDFKIFGKVEDLLKELNSIHLQEVILIANTFLKSNPQNQISGVIKNLNKFELLFDSIRLNVELDNMNL